MRVLVANRNDVASINIRDRVLEQGNWEESNMLFRGHRVWSRSEAVLLEVAGPTILDEQLDSDLKGTNWPIMDVWFLSRHAAQSGQPSLTVHPIGNHAAAQFGGQANHLVPAASRDMGALLRRMRHHASAAGLPHSVTYESTHHGPSMSVPSLFVEVGSEDKWYRDESSARAVALAIEDVLAGEGRTTGPVLVGAGGGHYVPRHTDLALAGDADFGHFIPSHFIDEENGKERLRRAFEATPGCQGLHIHKKGVKGAQRQALVKWAEELRIPLWPGESGGDDPVTGA